MSVLGDFVEVPESIEELDLTREVLAMIGTEKYRIEEQDYLEINDRLIVVQSGNIAGTLNLFGNCNLPDDQLGPAQWTIVFMGHRKKQMYPLRFQGDEAQCLRDIMLLRLSVT